MIKALFILLTVWRLNQSSTWARRYSQKKVRLGISLQKTKADLITKKSISPAFLSQIRTRETCLRLSMAIYVSSGCLMGMVIKVRMPVSLLLLPLWSTFGIAHFSAIKSCKKHLDMRSNSNYENASNPSSASSNGSTGSGLIFTSRSPNKRSRLLKQRRTLRRTQTRRKSFFQAGLGSLKMKKISCAIRQAGTPKPMKLTQTIQTRWFFMQVR